MSDKFNYHMVPTIMNINNQAMLERYLAELAEAQKLGLFENENLLIYGSLQKSGKFDIYTSLSPTEKASLEQFAKYLRHNYGSSNDEKRSEFGNMQQQIGESPPEFLRRLERSYFQIKGLTVPTELEEWHKSDLKWSFLSGLADPAVKKHMLLKDSNYENLGIDARKIEKQLSGLHKNIYNIKSANETPEETDDAFPTQSDVKMRIASIEMRLEDIEKILRE